MGYTFGYYPPPVADEEEDVAYDPATGKPITNPASVSFPYYMTLPTNQSGDYPSSQPPEAQNTSNTTQQQAPEDVNTGAPPDTADDPAPITTPAPDGDEYGQGGGDPYSGNPFAYGTPAYWNYENASPVKQQIIGMRMGEYMDYMEDKIESRWDKIGGGGSNGSGGGSTDQPVDDGLTTNPDAPMMGYSALPGGEGMSPEPESYLPEGWQEDVNGMDQEEFDEWYAELSPMEKAEFDAYMAAYSQMWAEMYQ